MGWLAFIRRRSVDEDEGSLIDRLEALSEAAQARAQARNHRLEAAKQKLMALEPNPNIGAITDGKG